MPCQEESVTDELLVVCWVRFAGPHKHRHDGSVATLHEVAARHVGTFGDANQRLVPARRVHEPAALPHRLRRRLLAVVEDYVLVSRADRERVAELGGAVVLRGVAGLFERRRSRGVEIFELVDVGDEQGGVAVEDVEDLEPVVAFVGPEVGGVVGAVDLEPEHPTVGLRCVVGDVPEREGDVHAAAYHGGAELSSLPVRCRRREHHPCRPERGDEGEPTTRTGPPPWEEHSITRGEGDSESVMAEGR